MFVNQIQWTPVRLESRRIDNNHHEIFRDGELVGFVERHEGAWRSRKPKRSAYPWDDCQPHSGWRAAVLRLARYSMIWASRDGPQDYGQVRMFRVNCATLWYTVIVDGDKRYVYQDFTISREPEGREQVMLRRVLDAAENHLRDEALRVVG